MIADRVRLDLPRSWYAEAAYFADPSFHEMKPHTDKDTRTWLLVNGSGIALRPVRFTLGNLEVYGIQRIEARFGAVEAAGASVVAEGAVLVEEADRRREGSRAEWRSGEWRVTPSGG